VSDVEVKFGGDTRGLDAATNRAKADINSLRPPVTGLQSTLAGLKNQIASTFNMPGLSSMRGEVGQFTSGVNVAGLATSGLMGALTGLAAGVGVAFSVDKLFDFAEHMSGLAERTDQLSQKLAVSATMIGSWGAVAGMANMSTESWASAMTKLEKAEVAAANGGKQQAAAFRALGIDVKKTTDQNEIMLQMADKFSAMADGPKKVALAMATMGRAGAEMIPILNMGRQAIEEQMKTAQAYGAVMDESLVAAGLRVDDAMDEMHLGFKGLANTLFSEIAPSIASCVEGMNMMILAMVTSYREGGAMKVLLSGLSLTIKVVAEAVAILATGFYQLWHIAVAAILSIMGPLYTLGRLIYDVFSGNMTDAAKNFKAGIRGTGDAINAEIAKVKKSGEDFAKFSGKLWNPPKPSPRSRPTGGGDLDIPGMGGAGKKGSDEAKKKAREAEQAALEELEFKKEMARDDFAVQMQLQEQKLNLLRKSHGEQSQEYIRALRERTRMQREHDQELLQLERNRLQLTAQIGKGRLETDRTIAQQSIDIERQRIEMDASNGRISEQQKVAALAALKEREYAMERKAADDIYQVQLAEARAELALQNLRPQERQRILDQITAMEAQHANEVAVLAARHQTDMSGISNQAAQATINKWKSVTQPIGQAFSGMFTALYNRQMSFKDAMLQAADQIVLHFAQKGIEMVANWAANKLAETTVHAAATATQTGITAAGAAAQAGAVATGQAAQVAATAAGQTAATGITITGALAQIGAHAATAAAGAYAALAAIPVIGPVIAPVAAVAALAAVLAIGSKIASASGGWGEVEDDQMAMVHKKEMVLPSKYATPLRAALSGWDSRGTGTAGTALGLGESTRNETSSNRGGDANFHYKPTHNYSDMSAERMLERDGAQFRKWIKNEVRNGNLKV
jgi:hypothetical protein